MPLKVRDVVSSLEAKGFERSEGDHSFFVYYSTQGKKSTVRTKVSHGSGNKDISDGLVGMMARQCKLSVKEFRNLVDCPLSRDQYEEILMTKGSVDSPAAE